MDSITSNIPDAIRQEAKQRALKIIEANLGCTSYVRPEDLETATLFIPVVSVIKPTKDDFYDSIPKIGIMAKPPLVNLIREKAGIEVLRTETEKRGEFSWHAHVYGQKRQPDGTMLPDDASYEFDAKLRSELDCLGQPDKYNTEIKKRMHLLETAKAGESRAVTGAQHALIHKLGHVARSFKTAEELMRGMIVVRIDRNVDGVLADPGLRSVALDRMLGATEAIYGPKQPETQTAPRTVDEESGEILTPAAEPGQGGLFPEAEPAKPEPEKSPVESLKEILTVYKSKIPAEAKAEKGTPIHSILDTAIANPAATEKEINTLVDHCAHYCQTHGITP